VDVTGDGGIMKFVIEEGKGDPITMVDDVYYRHETRFDNGQLVEIKERRKQIEKFAMGDKSF
jgi:ribosome-associated protein YbcJ (S4-like RNA binding protein)